MTSEPKECLLKMEIVHSFYLRRRKIRSLKKFFLWRAIMPKKVFHRKAVVLSQIYLGIGTPHLHRRYVLLLAFLIISLMYPGIKWFGLAGASGVLLLSNSVAVCMQVVWMRDAIGLRFKSYARCCLPVLSGKWLSPYNSFLKSHNK